MYKILVVDDEPQTRAFLTAMIPSIDPRWTVVGEAANGAAALALYDDTKPDLVLTDICMPEMNGMALCEALAAREPPPRLAIISGYDEFKYAKEAIRLGVSEYLLKPITRKELSTFLSGAAQSLALHHHQLEQLEMLQRLSSAYRKELIRNFCRAALDNVYIRIQTLQPLIHQMHLKDMQAVWCVTAVCSDASPVSGYAQWSQDRYLLLQLVRHLTEEQLKCGYVIEANDGTLILCVTGEDEEQVLSRCDALTEQAQDLCKSHFGTTLSYCRSDAKLDVLQLHEARKEADLLFPLAATQGPGRYLYQQLHADNAVCQTMKACGSLIEAWQKDDAAMVAAAVPALCASIAPGNEAAGVRMLLHAAHAKRCPHLQTIEKQLLTTVSPGSISLAETMLRVFASAQKRAPQDQSVGDKLVADAVDLIRKNLDKPISLGQIADMLDISANHLSRIFHATTGESYIKFVTRERMERASVLLMENPGIKVRIVAEQTGYYNIQHFCYVFKQYWNMTPTQYQHMHSAERLP